MNTMAIALAGTLLLGVSVDVAWAQKQVNESSGGQEVTGLFPNIGSSASCDYQCIETYEVKCTQSARYLYVWVGDDYTGAQFGTRHVDTWTQAQLIGVTPSTLNFKADSTDGYTSPGDYWLLFLIRPGGEGTMKATAAVQVVTYSGNFRDYDIDAACYSVVNGSYRTTSLVKKFDN